MGVESRQLLKHLYILAFEVPILVITPVPWLLPKTDSSETKCTCGLQLRGLPWEGEKPQNWIVC